MLKRVKIVFNFSNLGFKIKGCSFEPEPSDYNENRLVSVEAAGVKSRVEGGLFHDRITLFS